MENKLPNFIINGTCKKDEKTICNIGYACDACPYNKDIRHLEEGVAGYETMYPPVIKQKENTCYCCKKKVSEGNWIKLNAQDVDNVVFVCNNCNHLESKDEQEKQ